MAAFDRIKLLCLKKNTYFALISSANALLIIAIVF